MSFSGKTQFVRAQNVGWELIRSDFRILDQKVNGEALVYFDNAATSQKPGAVLDAIRKYYENDNANVHRGIHELSNRATAAFEAGRQRAAKFINAVSPDEIIFTRGTTEGINLVASTWGAANLKAGDKVLLTEMEHHSNIVPWQMLCERVGAKLVYVPVVGDSGELDMATFDRLLAEGVKLFSVTHLSNTLGLLNPVAELCRKARSAGAVTVVDAAQSAGHMRLDVQALGCDFLAFSGHKMCGPTGIGVLYGRLPLLENMPPYQGGGEMIQTVDFYKTTYNKPPHRFEAGTPDISGVVGLHAAMDYLDSIGRQAIFEHDQSLAEYAYELLSQVKGIRLFGPRVGRVSLVSFLLEDIHAHDLVTFADQKGIALRGGHHRNQPLMKKLGVPSTARASFYFYNNRDEVDHLMEVLAESQRFFSGNSGS